MAYRGSTRDRPKLLARRRRRSACTKGRIGYRASDFAAWLDARREVLSARELINSNWKQVGAAAATVVAKVRP